MIFHILFGLGLFIGSTKFSSSEVKVKKKIRWINIPWEVLIENHPKQWNPSLDKADIVYRQLAAESGYPWRNTKFVNKTNTVR